MAVSTTATLREQLINIILNELDNDQLERLLSYIHVLQLEAQHEAQYDPGQDFILTGDNPFQGLGNLGEQAEEILDSEYASGKSTRLSDNPPQAYPAF